MTQSHTPAVEALPVVAIYGYSDNIIPAESTNWFFWRKGLAKHQFPVALTPHAPAQAQIDALRIENERLRREVGELRDALTPFAMAPVTDDGAIIGLIRENFDDARAALKAGKDHGHE